MIYRKILVELDRWKEKKDRKPLIIRGARQVGKTTAVEMFSSKFDQFIHLNLDNRKDAEMFQHGLEVDELIQFIYLNKNQKMSKGKVLLFIDEIQNSPQAVAMLRYFYEKAGHLHIIAAGSLPETMMGGKQVGFPVGRVEYMFMYPMTFEEFLKAKGEDSLLSYYHQVPIPDLALSRLHELFHKYTLIGGMPEVAAAYFETGDITELADIFREVITSYLDDVSKYARNLSMDQCIRHVIESAPFEAGKRIKFHGFGNSNYRSREIGEAIKTLERAMLLYLFRPSTAVEPPVIPDLKKSPKLQFLDTGLLNFVTGMQKYFFQSNDINDFYRGLIAEHVIGQELIATHSGSRRIIHFWVREKKQSNAEIDFLLPYKQYVIPVEVKSGKKGSLKSLHQFINRTNHPYAVRVYGGTMEIVEAKTPEGTPYILLNLPYGLTGKITEYLEWMMKKKQ
ncbi:ATP-binding protein [Fibrobacterota bacterium]